ncbi:MAG: helix-turn-helix domain-containing protein [Patiriisocius sp.]|uniref:helix-turn-helix domain-containing protein n=1 Tax=Patiriisocius sp. TaxID=2822396 RepID=UPI003EF34A57
MYTFEQTQQDVAEVKKDLKELKALFFEKAEINPQNNQPKTIDEIVKLTGYTKPTLYGYCQKKTIPHHKKNGRLFFFESEIIDWIKQGKQKILLEIEADANALLSNKRKASENEK